MLAQMNISVYGNSAGNRHVHNITRQATILIPQQKPSTPPRPKPLSQKQHPLSMLFCTVRKWEKKREVMREGQEKIISQRSVAAWHLILTFSLGKHIASLYFTRTVEQVNIQSCTGCFYGRKIRTGFVMLLLRFHLVISCMHLMSSLSFGLVHPLFCVCVRCFHPNVFAGDRERQFTQSHNGIFIYFLFLLTCIKVISFQISLANLNK